MNSRALSDILLGCALGDAWGRSFERRSLDDITRAHGSSGADLPDGTLYITDDTQMALYLAEAVRGNPPDLKERVLAAWVTWMNDPENYRAPGETCLASARRISEGKPWHLATAKASDGSGAVMRTWACAYLPERLRYGVSLWQAASTHGGSNAITASVVATRMVAEGVSGGTAIDHLVKVSSDFTWVTDDDMGWLCGLHEMGSPQEVREFLDNGRAEILRKVSLAKEFVRDIAKDPWSADPSEVFPGWRSHDALVCAVVCMDLFPNDPYTAVRRAVCTEGDSDTIAAVTGALCASSAPFPWAGLDREWTTRLEPAYLPWIESFRLQAVTGVETCHC